MGITTADEFQVLLQHLGNIGIKNINGETPRTWTYQVLMDNYAYKPTNTYLYPDGTPMNLQNWRAIQDKEADTIFWHNVARPEYSMISPSFDPDDTGGAVVSTNNPIAPLNAPQARTSSNTRGESIMPLLLVGGALYLLTR